MVFGHVHVGAIEESDTLFLEFGVLLDGAAEGVGLRELAVLGHDAVARRRIAAWIGVEGMADAAGVAGAQGAGEVPVGGDFTFGDLSNKRVDLGEEVHFKVR